MSDEELPYGRIVRKADGAFSHIVEDKDCTPEEKAIRELNVGVYVFEAGPLWEAIDQLQPNNAQGEYYLTDAPGLHPLQGWQGGGLPHLYRRGDAGGQHGGAGSTRWRTSSAEGRGGHESLSQRRH